MRDRIATRRLAAASIGALAASALGAGVRATPLLYEPFNYAVTDVSGGTGTQGVSGTVGSAHNSNTGLTPSAGLRWYPTSTAFAGNAAGQYQIAKDGAITLDNLVVPNLDPSGNVATNAMTLGGYGYTPKLAAFTAQTAPADSGVTSVYYSFALRVNDLRQLNFQTEGTSGAAFPVTNTTSTPAPANAGAPAVTGVGIGSIGALYGPTAAAPANGQASQENGNPSNAPGVVQVRPLIGANGDYVLDNLGRRLFNVGVSVKDPNPNSNGGNTNGSVFDTVPYSEGETLFVVGRYDLVSPGAGANTNNDVANLYINPTPGGAEPSAPTVSDAISNIADPTSIQSIWFRQSGGPTNAQATPDSYTVDTVRVGTTYADVTPVPEPAATALALIAAGALASRRGRGARRVRIAPQGPLRGHPAANRPNTALWQSCSPPSPSAS